MVSLMAFHPVRARRITLENGQRGVVVMELG